MKIQRQIKEHVKNGDLEIALDMLFKYLDKNQKKSKKHKDLFDEAALLSGQFKQWESDLRKGLSADKVQRRQLEYRLIQITNQIEDSALRKKSIVYYLIIPLLTFILFLLFFKLGIFKISSNSSTQNLVEKDALREVNAPAIDTTQGSSKEKNRPEIHVPETGAEENKVASTKMAKAEEETAVTKVNFLNEIPLTDSLLKNYNIIQDKTSNSNVISIIHSDEIEKIQGYETLHRYKGGDILLKVNNKTCFVFKDKILSSRYRGLPKSEVEKHIDNQLNTFIKSNVNLIIEKIYPCLD